MMMHFIYGAFLNTQGHLTSKLNLKYKSLQKTKTHNKLCTYTGKAQ